MLPESECIYTVHQEQLMFYSRRLAFPLPTPEEVKDEKNGKRIDECKFIHINYTNSHPYYPGGYPIGHLQNKFKYLFSTTISDHVESPTISSLIEQI